MFFNASKYKKSGEFYIVSTVYCIF